MFSKNDFRVTFFDDDYDDEVVDLTSLMNEMDTDDPVSSTVAVIYEQSVKKTAS